MSSRSRGILTETLTAEAMINFRNISYESWRELVIMNSACNLNRANFVGRWCFINHIIEKKKISMSINKIRSDL